jgi:hypothetical protein
MTPKEQQHEPAHERLRDKVNEAIAEFREVTGGTVKTLYYRHGALDITTTLSPPTPSEVDPKGWTKNSRSLDGAAG